VGLHKVFLSMIPEPVDDSHSAADACSEPSRHARHRRHRHRRSLYRNWIRPYRRELRTIILLCIFVLAAYLLWQVLAAS
jgi:hypothetical protein